MRLNMPVSNIEYELPDGVSIVSKTDLKGRITYVNESFIEVSGFTEEELIGKPHNIIRHPDMPAEAFSDLWVTLSERLPWTGMVKNRRKNGDYYWVMANVTPLRKTPPTIGFLSVRNKPTREQIAEAERVYRLFSENRARNLKIWHGRVVRTDLMGKFMNIRDIPIATRIMATAISAALLMAIVGLLGWWETTPAAKLAGVLGWMPALLVIAGGAGALLFILYGYFISRSILKPLERSLEVAHAISWGDLSLQFEISETDETAPFMRALNQMKTNLVAVISEVGTHVDSIAASAKNISALSARIKNGDGEQVGSTIADSVPNIALDDQLIAAELGLMRQMEKLEEVVGIFKLK